MDLTTKRLVIAGLAEQRPDLANLMAWYGSDKFEILAHYYSLRHEATASRQQVIDEAYRLVVALDLSFFKELGRKLKTGAQRIVQLFKIPEIVTKLKEFIGDLSIKGILDFVKKGAGLAKKIGKVLKDKAWFIITEKKIPTLTSLIEKTELGLKAKGIYQDKVEPWVNIVDAWMKKYIPTLSRIALAALFAYIWFNVEEISWEPTDLLHGFTGALSLSDLLATLPESGVGFLLSQLMGGLGYTIMPYILIPRLIWLLTKGYIKWRKGKFESTVEPVEAWAT